MIVASGKSVSESAQNRARRREEEETKRNRERRGGGDRERGWRKKA